MVTLHKHVEISNPRLQMLYWLIYVVVAACFVGWFVIFRKWTDTFNASSKMRIVMWPNVMKPEAWDRSSNLAMNLEMCQSAEKFDYWWDAEGDWRYENYSCLPSCQFQFHSHECASVLDGTLRLSEAEYAIPLSYMDSYYPNPGSKSPRYGQEMHWVSSADIQSISLSYSYDFDTGGIKTAVWKTTHIASSETHLTTVLVDSHKGVRRVVPPGELINLTVPELLALAGFPGALNEVNALATPNEKPNATLDRPIMRTTGLELQINLECSNNAPFFVEEEALKRFVGQFPDGSVCILSVLRTASDWVSEDQVISIEDGWLRRKAYVLRIVAQPDAKFEFFSGEMLTLTLIVITVVLRYPSNVMRFIVVYLLGHLSTMYRRVLTESFNVSAQVANATTRLLSSSSCYAYLRGSSEDELALDEIVRPMRIVLDEQVNWEVIQTLGHFCLQQVSTHDEGSKSVLRKIGTSLGTSAAMEELSGHASSRRAPEVSSIGCAAFARAHATSDPIDFDDVTKLFDRERNVGLIEHLFTPGDLWNHIHSAKHAHRLSRSSGRVEREVLSEDGGEGDEKEKEEGKEEETGCVLEYLKKRLETVEVRLATSERSLAAWKQKSFDLTSTCARLEEKLKEMELRLKQCSKAGAAISDFPEKDPACDGLREINVDDAEEALLQALPPLPSSLKAAVAELSAGHVSTQADVRELDARVLRLQRQVLVANSDISAMRQRFRLMGLPSVPSAMSPANTGGAGSLLATQGALQKLGGDGAELRHVSRPTPTATQGTCEVPLVASTIGTRVGAFDDSLSTGTALDHPMSW